MILHWFCNSQFDSQNLPNFPRANLQNILNNTSRKYYWTTSGSRILVETKSLVDKSNLFVFATKVHTKQKKKEKKTFNTNNNNSKEIKDKTWNQNHNNNNETDCSIVQTFLCLQQKLTTRNKKTFSTNNEIQIATTTTTAKQIHKLITQERSICERDDC